MLARALSIGYRSVLLATVFYRYGFSLTGDDPFKEHRIMFEQTFRQPLPFGLLLSDRNREEIRIVNGNTSGRYRIE